MSTHLVLGLALVVGAPALKPDPKQTAIIGEWAYHEVLGEDGEKLPCAEHRMVFGADGRVVVSIDGKGFGDNWYTVNVTSDPPTIDWSSPGAFGIRQVSSVGIWKVERDTLRMCATNNGYFSRPTSFEPGPNRLLITLKRAKKD